MASLNVFPLTPMFKGEVDVVSLERIISRLSLPEVAAITVLGSTGSGPYLTRAERRRVLETSVAAAGDTPVHAGVGDLRTERILEHIDDVAACGATAVLVPAVSYQPLRDAEVVALFERVAAHSPLPVVVYDNPITTGVRFTLDMFARVAALPNVSSIKIAPLPSDAVEAAARVRALRARIPEWVTIGISGDGVATQGMAAGCDLWYSALGGTLPHVALDILAGGEPAATKYAPLFALFTRFGGSVRVIAAVAHLLGLTREGSLPGPVQPLSEVETAEVAAVLEELRLCGGLRTSALPSAQE